MTAPACAVRAQGSCAAPEAPRDDDAARVVDFVRVENDAGLSDDALASQLPIVIGEPRGPGRGGAGGGAQHRSGYLPALDTLDNLEFPTSGFGERDLSGQHAARVRGPYYRGVADVLFQPAYSGGSPEGGNVWEDSDDIAADELITATSVFLGADTPPGPFYLGHGRADAGRGAFYPYLGRITGR